MQAAKETSSKWKKKYDLALVRQQEYTRRKREIMMEKKLKDAEEHYIVALYFTNSMTRHNVGPQYGWLTINVVS